jgi:glycosyltransferase involved in cell wall biosynthesis
MACGACVLTTRRLSLPEVGGDAVAYCGVGAGDVAAALGELLADPGRRAELATAAQQRAKEFSWATTAERHREAYAKAWSRHLRTR